MKLEEGMYVRTKEGLIAKYTGYEKDEENAEYNKYQFDGKIYWYYEYYNNYVYEENFQEWFEEKVIKVGHDITDLISVGDYVNGYRITLIHETKAVVYVEDEKGYLIKSFGKEDIKSIVTKERFENMCYKVGE